MNVDHPALIVTALSVGAVLGLLIGDLRGFTVEPLLYVGAGVTAMASILFPGVSD